MPMPDLNSGALTLFLQYIHHHRQPDLSRLSFECLSQLAEAVEKYDVYSATEICKLHMRLVFFCARRPCTPQRVRVTSSHVEKHCVGVFQYASKHGYRNLMNDAARIAVQDKYLRNKISDVCNCAGILSAWVGVFPLHCEERTNFCCRIATKTIFLIYFPFALKSLHPSCTLAEPRIASDGGNSGMWSSPK